MIIHLLNNPINHPKTIFKRYKFKFSFSFKAYFMGADTNMKTLSQTLVSIQVVLEDAEDKQLKSMPIRNWLRQLSGLAHEIDDVLDECATQISKSNHKSSKLNRYSLKKIRYGRKIGKRVKALTHRLDALAAERYKFHLCEMMVENKSKIATTRETSPVLNKRDDVCGRDEEKEKIVHAGD